MRRAATGSAGHPGRQPVGSASEALVEEAIRRILAAGNPLRIVLFGSRARGQERPGSDLDLLIIEDSALPRHKRAVPYLRALTGLFPEKDVVVWTPEEADAWKEVPNAFVTTALREGRTLYAR
ncbi:MAG: nucleotidyltransferase domain-containing protein [Deferrisomatales bacterium]|nr:nucleotidyltransferase domain-containing protein [Deferrisomatales bacterium]